MRLTFIFVIVGFICTIYAVPLPPSSASITRKPTARPRLYIDIVFQDGISSTSAEAQHGVQERVAKFMKAALHSAIVDEGKLKFPPYNQIHPPYELVYQWQNVPHLPLPSVVHLTWTVTYHVPGLGVTAYSDTGKGWISLVVQPGEKGPGSLETGTEDQGRYCCSEKSPTWMRFGSPPKSTPKKGTAKLAKAYLDYGQCQ